MNIHTSGNVSIKNSVYVALILFATLALFAPIATHAASVAIDSITPGVSVLPKNRFTLKVVTSGFVAQSYQLSDSFVGTTLTVNNIDQAGLLFWVPLNSDAGTHNLTITAQDFNGNSAVVTQTITVLPPPSIKIENVSPSDNKILPGNALTFQIVPTGLTKPTYRVSSSFGGSIAHVQIPSSGLFSWTPEHSDSGEHKISIEASDSQGSTAFASIDVRVGAGPTVGINSVTPGPNITLGQTLQLNVGAMNFSPTSFGVSDTFPGTTLSNGHMMSTGQLSWTPSASDVGRHDISVTGTVGLLGASATSEKMTFYVLRPGESAPATQSPAVLGASTAAPALANMSSNANTEVINTLQSQIAELNAKIATQTGMKPAASLPPVGGVFATYLYQGMDGDEVVRLQTVLTKEGFFSGEVSGHFGPLTVAAVKKFQEAHGLTQLGVVGPATRAALNALSNVSKTEAALSNSHVFENFIAWGDHGTDVLELQKRLISLGFLSGEATGYFGAMTYAAVKAFQTANGLDAKGHVGPGTRAALNK